MTIVEIFEQAKALSAEERKELVKMLVDTLDASSTIEAVEQEEHWGKSLNQLLDKTDPIELKYPEIEDPVEWVKHLRAEERKRRLGDWGDDL